MPPPSLFRFSFLSALGRPLPFLLGAVLAFLSVFAVAPAQWGGVKNPVSATAVLEPATAPKGGVVRLNVTATVDPDYHIYAMETLGEGPFPTTITIAKTPWLSLDGPWVEPTPTIKFDKGFEVDIASHYGSPLLFTAPLRIAEDAPAGPHELEVTLTTQACLEESCLAPMKNMITVTLVVEDRVEVAPRAVATTDTARAITQTVADPILEKADKSIVGFMIAAFGFGLVSLLTPCVFPMIPLTISFFTKRASSSRAEALKLSWVYASTIVVGFTAVGILAAMILRMLGADSATASGVLQRIAANPVVNLSIAGIFIFFAFSLLGFFEIALPSGLGNRLQKAKGNRKDTVGAIFMALIFVVISFTCTAPFVGVLLVEAFSGGWKKPIFGMLSYGLGFASPFYILSLAPRLLNNMPKGGNWMNSVKVTMGFLELAAAFKFISNADLVWKWGIFSREVLLALWTLIGILTCVYLFNKIRLPHDEPEESIGPARLTFAMFFGTAGLVLAAGLFGRPLPGVIESYLPPSEVYASGTTVDKLSWHDEYEPALAEARASGKPIFLDFTGYTCTNCRMMEKNVFPRPAIDQRLREFVRVKLWTDDQEVGERHMKFQAEKFGTVALPTYVVLTPDGETIAIEGYTLDEDRFRQFLDRGLATRRS